MDLNSYYSDDPRLWEIVLGPKMHYHFLSPNTTDNDPFDQVIIDLFPYIPKNSTVLDCGCGWGGTGNLLIKERNCSVTGVTISRAQAEYIKNFKTICSDLHDFIPTEHYDVALFVESYTHLNEPERVLSNIKSNINSVVIADLTYKNYGISKNWNIHQRTNEMYIKELEASGFKIKEFIEMPFSSEKSLDFYFKNLIKLNPKDITGHFKQLFEICYKSKFQKGDPNLEPLQCHIYATRVT